MQFHSERFPFTLILLFYVDRNATLITSGIIYINLRIKKIYLKTEDPKGFLKELADAFDKSLSITF